MSEPDEQITLPGGSNRGNRTVLGRPDTRATGHRAAPTGIVPVRS